MIATGNAGKLREYRELLADTGLELIGDNHEVDEVGETYADNARPEVQPRWRLGGVETTRRRGRRLNGFPGIRSARLGRHRRSAALLLHALEGHPRPWIARFTCTIALLHRTRHSVLRG